MLYLLLVVVVIALILLLRLHLLKKEIKRMVIQLHQINGHRLESKLTLQFYDRDIENLAKEMNEQIDIKKQSLAEKRRSENEIRQTIANISHDIRTPMTSILGYIQFLEMNDLSPEKRIEYTRIVKNSALRLKVLLEDFFELSVIESLDYPLSYEKIKLNQLLMEVVIGFYEEFHQMQMEPALIIPEQEIYIHADSSAIKRVMENIILNAIRHSSGNISIQLQTMDHKAQLLIRNSVYQLSQEDLEHLFDRFYKADQTRMGKGTGLGLSIAKTLMKKMNGDLTAKLNGNQLEMICEWPNGSQQNKKPDFKRQS